MLSPNAPRYTYTQTHHPHTHHSLPTGLPGREGTALKVLLGGPGPVGCAQRADPYPRGAPYRSGDVWGVKIGRPSREAIVAGVLARAHALERHLGSSGSVPCGWNTKAGFRDGGQARQLAGAAPHGRLTPASPPQGTLPPLSITNTNKGGSMRTKSLSLPPVPGVTGLRKGGNSGCGQARALGFTFLEG